MGRLPGVSVAKRSGLILPPGRIRREVLKSRSARKMSHNFLIATAAVTEFALRKLLTDANDIAKQEQSEKIEKHHLAKALRDEFLASVFHGVYLSAIPEKT
jgi:hypothetical protein